MPSRSERKLLRSLAGRKGRREQGLFLLEGPRLLEELLAAGTPIVKLLHTRAASEDAGVGPLLERATCRAPVEEVSEAELARFADTASPQGVLAVAERPRWGWADVTVPRLLVLDAVQDPGNVGTLLRTAEALGLGGVIALPGTADPFAPKAVRAAAGSTLRLPVLTLTWEETADELARREIALWAADAAGEPARRGDPVPERLALAVGNEGAGLSPPVRAAAGRAVAVPVRGRVESLNVAAAAAILADRLFGERG